MTRLSLLLLAITFSGVAISQDTIWVKNISRKLQVTERRYLQYTEMPDGKVKLSALLSRKAQTAKFNNKDALLVVQTYQLQNGVDIDSSYVDPETLHPIAYYTAIQSEGHREKVIFNAKEIENIVEYKDSTERFIHPDRGWFNGVITDDIISSLPLKENTRFAFRAINPGKRYYEYTVVVTVEGKEELDLPGFGRVMCWRVRNGSATDGTLEWYTVNDQIQVKRKYKFKNGNVFYRVMVGL